MAFAQLTYRESLRGIQACLRAAQTKLYHLGIRGRVSRNRLANANQVRDWRIYADFAKPSSQGGGRIGRRWGNPRYFGLLEMLINFPQSMFFDDLLALHLSIGIP